ncbi:hypothetical protein ACFQYP_21635 [Nonomuraea antimicrobica]
MLSEAKDLIERSREVVLAEQYQNAIGMSEPKSFVVTDGRGNTIDLADAVANAINAAVPGAADAVVNSVNGNEVTTPNLGRQLRVDFGAERPLIRLAEMWSRRGLGRQYNVSGGSLADGAQVVNVRVRVQRAQGEDPRKATLETHISDAGLIVQHYRYVEASHTEARNAAYSVGFDYAAEPQDSDALKGDCPPGAAAPPPAPVAGRRP